MKEIGSYCKAYTVRDYRSYPGWSEDLGTGKVESHAAEAESNSAPGLSDDDILYLQENFTVTRGIYLNEDVIFDKVTPEWIEFCKSSLNFSLPAETV
jgi:hypothetical protein